MEMALLIKLLPIVFRAINVAPQIQEAMRIGTPIVKAVEEHADDPASVEGNRQTEVSRH